MTPADCAPTTEIWFATPRAAELLDTTRLDPADQLTWDRLRSSRRRLDWASSRALRQALSRDLGSGWNSSLSHCRGHAAVARVRGNVAIGVDLEWLAPRDFLSMAFTAFAPDEARELESLQEEAELCAKFYEYWTLKEAFAKALQLPLAEALVKCCFARTGSTAARVPTARPWRAIVYAPRDRLRLAVVSVDELETSSAGMPRTMEWPPGREAAWPVVQKFEGVGAGHRGSC